MSSMYTPRNAANPTTTTLRACIALWRMSVAAKRHAMTAANKSARNNVDDAINRRCLSSVDDKQNASATARARHANSGVTSHGYHDFSQPEEYGWYDNSKSSDAAVASVNNGSLRHTPIPIKAARQAATDTTKTRSI